MSVIEKCVYFLLFLLGSMSKPICSVEPSKEQEDKEFHQMVGFMEDLYELFLNHDIKIPLLTDILTNIRCSMIKEGISVDDELFERLHAEFKSFQDEIYGTE